MTVTTENSRISYATNGTTTVFAYPQYFINASDLKVYYTSASGVETLLALTTDYSVSGAGEDVGGFVTLLAAMPTGTLTIYNDPPVTQLTDYTPNGRFPAESHERALDKLTMIIQRTRDQIGSAIHLPNGETGTTTELASSAVRRNKLLGFGSLGELIYPLGPTFVSGNAVGTAQVDSLATAQVTTFAVSTHTVRTDGYAQPGDGGSALYKRVVSQPSHPGKWQDASGAWFELNVSEVHGRMFGTKADGTTDDTTAIDNAHLCALALHVDLVLSEGTHIITAPKTRTGTATGTRYCAFDLLSNTRWRGVKGLTILKVAGGQSSDVTPKDINIFIANTSISGVHLQGIIFDCNGQNNLVSPNRASHSFNHLCGGSINVTGNEASLSDSIIEECEFKNCAGTNQIVTGQGANGFAAPLGRNVTLRNNKFRNNGLDVDDHSTIYNMSEGFRCYGNEFRNDSDTLSLVDRNWVAWESHAADAWFEDNSVNGYFRTCWIASNYTRPSVNHNIVRNSCNVLARGPSMFRQLSDFTEIEDINFIDNHIAMDSTSTATSIVYGIKIGIDINQEYTARGITVRGNKIRFSGTGYNTAGIGLSCGGAGQVVSGVEISGNEISRAMYGVYARLNTGNGRIDEVREFNNQYIDLGETSPGDECIGSYYQADDGTVFFGKVSITRNRYIASLSHFTLGVKLSGIFDEAEVDDCIFDGMTNFPNSLPYSILDEGTITRRLGRQLRTGPIAPTVGSHRNGEWWWNSAPTQVKNISHWIRGAGDFRAVGSGYGDTSQRPSLTAQDYGYLYFDTQISKMLIWTGGGFLGV